MDKMDLKDKIYNEMLADIVNLKYKPGEFRSLQWKAILMFYPVTETEFPL